MSTEKTCEVCGSIFRVKPCHAGRRTCCITCHNRRPDIRAASSARAKARIPSPALLRSNGEAASATPEYEAWRAMKRRCAENNRRAKPYYFDRGITVCERWAKSFPAFLEDVGRRPSGEFSLDRIDNDRGYEPGNVRWATWTQQMNNRRNCRAQRVVNA